MPKVLKFTPSSLVADIEIGQLFILEDNPNPRYNNKTFLLIGRDPWAAYIVRYTRWDAFVARAANWVISKIK